MIHSAYSKYFQKSRSFLYPLLGFTKKIHPGPLCTYLGYGTINPEHRKLICLFECDPSPAFQKFQEDKLMASPLYENHKLVEGYLVYVFDLSNYQKDWDLFLEGKYSKLSEYTKQAIKNYYGSDSYEYQFIDTYLYPDKYFELYSNLLDIEESTLKSVGELCDQYDKGKEVLIFTTKDLEISDQTT